MSVGMTQILHVKLPVTDLQRSVDWYAALMDLDLTHEFISAGELRGAALRSAEGGFSFALRLREHCPGQPSLHGFDVVALHLHSREALVRPQQRCWALGVECSSAHDRGKHEAIVDVADPDSTILRFYWVLCPGSPGAHQPAALGCRSESSASRSVSHASTSATRNRSSRPTRKPRGPRHWLRRS